MMKEETDKAIEFMDWMSDWFYSTIPDKKEYLEISQKIIDTKALLQEGGKANNKKFIDELGKFITSDNNYFFQPTISLIYIVFIIIFLNR